MTDRNQKLVLAAQTVFAKYGISKTTMNDIAQEAGVARQTLYNAYPNKEAILRAAVRAAGDASIQAVTAGWAEQTDLGTKLDTYFTHGPLSWYDAIQASPEAADLIDGLHSIAGDEVQDMNQRWRLLFTDLVSQHAGADIEAAAMADFIYSTSTNAKYQAPDRATLVKRLDILKQAVLALTGN